MGRKRRKPSTDKWDVLEKAKRCIPPVETILDNAWSALSLDEEFIRHYFGEALRQIDERAMEIYLKHERRAMKFAAQEWLEQRRKRLQREWDHLSALLQEDRWEAFKRKVVPMFMDFARLFQRLEKALGNMRKARAGSTFERAVEKLLREICIRCGRPKKKKDQKELERFDLVVPDVETACNTPDRAIFLELKRTLGERWKQKVAVDPKRSKRCWLLTIDHKLGDEKVKGIYERICNKDLGAFFVPEDVANKLRQKGETWVRSLNELPEALREALGGEMRC